MTKLAAAKGSRLVVCSLAIATGALLAVFLLAHAQSKPNVLVAAL